MQLTRELIQAQRAKAISDRDELLSKMNAQIGAINLCDHLLSVLDLPEAPPPPPAPPVR